MSRPLKPAARPKREPFFGALQPVAVPGLILALGLFSVATFYGSVLAAAHVVAADSGLGREQLGRITVWVCALFLAQGLVPIYRFGTKELPRLVAGHLKANARDMLLFVVLLIAAAFLFL